MFRNSADYLQRRWIELGVPQKTDEITARNRVTESERKSLAGLAATRRASEALRTVVRVSPRMLDLEEQYKAVQCPAFHRIVGELYHEKGLHDTGLSVKTAGNNWNGFATDIVALKPIDSRGNIVDGNFHLIDAVVSMGSADAQPTWNDIGDNPHTDRPWAIPPVPGGIDPPVDPPEDAHRYEGGGNDTGICDVCGLSRFDSVHAIPESKTQHDYDGGEQDTGLCDICQRDADDPIHQKDTPVPDTKHEFVGSATAKYCEECGKLRTDPIHQVAPPNNGTTFDDSRIVAKLDTLIAEQKATTQAINELRASVVKAVKDLIAVVPLIIKGKDSKR